MSALAFSRAVSILVCSLGIAAALVGDAASQGSSRSRRPLVSEAQFEAWQTELSNWGRWGKDDELGTLNLITPAKRRAALALVKEGVPVSLSTNTFTEKAVDVPCPAEWAMTTTYANRSHRSRGVSLHPRRGLNAHRFSRSHVLRAERCGMAMTHRRW